jgi:hypothetical protein
LVGGSVSPRFPHLQQPKPSGKKRSSQKSTAAIMLLCPTERARTSADAHELKLLYAKFCSEGCSVAPVLDDLLLQAVQQNSSTGFYYQVDPDVGRGSKRSLVSAAAATVGPEGSWCHLEHIVSPLARRVSFLADVLTQLERGYSFTLCTASVRTSYLTSMTELGEICLPFLKLFL